jgi:signal transduction histidine kinase
MRALIDDLLTFSRLDRAARELESVPVAEVVAEAVRSLAGAAEQVEVAGDLPVVRGARSPLGQLFQNLIGNALKFAGDEPLRVVVSAERAGTDWEFSVRDNGIGIAEQDRERVFEIFERLHGRGEFGGTGVGLAICRKVVELHGGRIWVQQSSGGGSDFRFTLPGG